MVTDDQGLEGWGSVVLKEIVLFGLEGFLPRNNIGLFSIHLFPGCFLGPEDLPRSFVQPLSASLQLLEYLGMKAFPQIGNEAELF